MTEMGRVECAAEETETHKKWRLEVGSWRGSCSCGVCLKFSPVLDENIELLGNDCVFSNVRLGICGGDIV